MRLKEEKDERDEILTLFEQYLIRGRKWNRMENFKLFTYIIFLYEFLIEKYG